MIGSFWREEMVQEHDNSQHHHLQQQQQQQQLAKYGGGNAAAATGVARASRKNKPKKIPQRGLGVAQLEKLRIEEQKKMGGGAPAPVPTTATPSSLALSGGGLCHLPPLHHPPPPPHPLTALSRPSADGGVHCGFSPVLWNPVDPTKHPYKRSLCPQPPLPVVSTGLSLTASSSQPAMEPPSNQMYSSFGSRSSAAAPAPAEEEREMAGVDRSWPFMFEGMTAAAAYRTTSKAPPPPPLAPFPVRAASQSGLADVSPDLSRFEFRTSNYFSASAYANSSDWAPEFTSCRSSSSSRENGRGRDAAFLTLSSQPAHLIRQPHVVPSIHIPEFSDFSAGAMPFQQGSVSGSSSSPPPKPFYSFLPVGPVRCERTPGECKVDVSEGGVDLELKLWKG